MTDAGEFEKQRMIEQQIHATYGPRIVALESASFDVAKLAIQSAFLVNGGALVAVPAYLALAPSKLTVADLAPSFISFVLGIILAAICAYCAYANYQAVSLGDMNQRDTKLLELSEQFTPEYFHRMKTARDEYRNYLEGRAKFGQRFANVTLWTANVTGWLSYIAFAVGCCLAAALAMS